MPLTLGSLLLKQQVGNFLQCTLVIGDSHIEYYMFQ